MGQLRDLSDLDSSLALDEMRLATVFNTTRTTLSPTRIDPLLARAVPGRGRGHFECGPIPDGPYWSTSEKPAERPTRREAVGVAWDAMNARLRVLIADDERPARSFLAALLRSFNDVMIVAEAETGRDCGDGD